MQTFIYQFIVLEINNFKTFRTKIPAVGLRIVLLSPFTLDLVQITLAIIRAGSRDQDLGLGGKSSAEGARIEAPSAPRVYGSEWGMGRGCLPV